MDSTTVVRDFANTAPSRAPAKAILEELWDSPPAKAFQQNTTTSFENKRPSTLFADCSMSFAIDISQSTKGRILAEECAFIQNFAAGLSPGAKDVVRVMPWDEISHKIITVEELNKIDPGGRTDPNVLLRNREYIDLLQDSQLWFLLTDGQIFPNVVRTFALNVNSRSLHGTACVLVIFGKRPAKPILCNVSVGISVFAVTPNCIFVFHDVDTHIGYVLQCKGCFSTLLSLGVEQVRLDSTTEWYNIPKLNYPDLFDIQVPAPTRLDINQFQLQSGRKINLDDLYRGKVSREIEEEILRNDDDLKSVILTATTRGQNRDIHDWVSARRDGLLDLIEMPRPDINGTAATLIKVSIQALQRKDTYANKIDLHNIALQKAHSLNWKTFRDSIEPRRQQATQRTLVVDDVLTRLALIKQAGLSSAECISPVSPGGQQWVARSRRTDQGPISKLLSVRGYLVDGFGTLKRPVPSCQICGSTQPYFALILKSPPEGEHTPGFPPTESRSEILYPFAIQNFPETDILSRLVCCAACSVPAVEYGHSPYHECLVGALVFGDRLSGANDINKRTWIANLDKALDGRFTQECLLPIVLAIMYNAKDHVSSTDTVFANALDNACTILQDGLQIPYENGNHHWTGRISDVVLHYLSIGIASPGCDFLNHPINSFVLMIRVAANISKEKRAIALFYRLLLHIIEHSYTQQDTEDDVTAAEFYGLLRSRISRGGSSEEETTTISLNDSLDWSLSSSPRLLETLCDNHSMDNEALRVFRRAGDIFSIIEIQCGTAICLFICLFHAVNTGVKEPRELLCWFCTRPEMNNFFLVPWSIHDTESKTIWESLT
ncbi:MAG: hypothetical protein M1834_001503 [Cirrosporium novae-zelandiae]|nr:MAG: hypothetical protein M1834_004020 [Cirrosporium novae-zelandiae]KAI9735488.1 MAG: hypothetical protein M1834_001503 [Cirrosporium novae-zelandiae]